MLEMMKQFVNLITQDRVDLINRTDLENRKYFRLFAKDGCYLISKQTESLLMSCWEIH